jgi:hypothetical protein
MRLGLADVLAAVVWESSQRTLRRAKRQRSLSSTGWPSGSARQQIQA